MPGAHSVLFYAKLAEQIEEHEGFVPHAYRDSAGLWTIGIGKMIDQTHGGGITHAQAVALLDDEVKQKEAELDQFLPWWREMSDVRQRVLLEMAYNLGIKGLLLFRNTLASMRLGQWPSAATGMRASLWAAQVGNRAERLARMMERDEDVPKWW